MTAQDQAVLKQLDRAIREEAAQLLALIREKDGEGNLIPDHKTSRLRMALVRHSLLNQEESP